jgi:hypothetical protein
MRRAKGNAGDAFTALRAGHGPPATFGSDPLVQGRRVRMHERLSAREANCVRVNRASTAREAVVLHPFAAAACDVETFRGSIHTHTFARALQVLRAATPRDADARLRDALPQNRRQEQQEYRRSLHGPKGRADSVPVFSCTPLSSNDEIGHANVL